MCVCWCAFPFLTHVITFTGYLVNIFWCARVASCSVQSGVVQAPSACQASRHTWWTVVENECLIVMARLRSTLLFAFMKIQIHGALGWDLVGWK